MLLHYYYRCNDGMRQESDLHGKLFCLKIRFFSGVMGKVWAVLSLQAEKGQIWDYSRGGLKSKLLSLCFGTVYQLDHGLQASVLNSASTYHEVFKHLCWVNL